MLLHVHHFIFIFLYMSHERKMKYLLIYFFNKQKNGFEPSIDKHHPVNELLKICNIIRRNKK